MSVVVSALKEFNKNFKRIIGYINQEDVDQVKSYQDLNEFNELSESAKNALKEGTENATDFKNSLKYDGKGHNTTIEKKTKRDKNKEKNDIERM